MPAKGDFPGLQRKPPDTRGAVAMYWAAPRRAINVGYEPETVRIDGFDDVASRKWPLPRPLDARALELAALCEEFLAQTEKWLAEKDSPDRPLVFDGTIGGLINIYQTHPESPYQELEESSRNSYDRLLKQIRRVMGKVRLDQIHAIDLRRWYKLFRKPKNEKDREHVSGAHHLIGMVRTMVKFGAECGVAEAIRLREEMRDMEFEDAPARERHVTYEMAVAFIARAHQRGDHEMATAQAFQYDGTLRQTDVIGKWETKTGAPKWVSGILWQEISRPEFVLDHVCGKTRKRTGQRAIIPLKKYSLIMDELARLGELPDIGPVIIDHRTGQPFEYEEFRSRWREIADEAGIPKNVWNRDSRAGGITEGGDAGADIRDLAQHAAHTDIQTTMRYDRKTVAKTSRVADIRVEYRNKT